MMSEFTGQHEPISQKGDILQQSLEEGNHLFLVFCSLIWSLKDSLLSLHPQTPTSPPSHMRAAHIHPNLSNLTLTQGRSKT